MVPGPFFNSDTIILLCLLIAILVLFNYCKHLLPLDTSNPLCSANRWDWKPHCKLGLSTLVVLCAGSTLLLTPVVRPATSQLATPLEFTTFSYWLIKPWFLNDGKLATVLIIPSSWGSPTVWNRCYDKHHQALFLVPLPEREGGLLQGESLISNLFTLLLFCLVYFTLSCLVLFIKNTHKN